MNRMMKRILALFLIASLIAPSASPAADGLGALRETLKGAGIEERGNAAGDARATPPEGAGTQPRRIEPGATDDLTRAGFDHPDLWLGKLDYGRVLSDFAMENVKSMTVEDIQTLLERNGSVLAKPIDGKKPSEMILAAAQKYGISPKVLCATLQKEQGLVTKKTATKAKLDWALGVGVYDNGKRLTGYKGFANQIEGAAETLRKLYDEGKAKFDGGAKTIPYKTLGGDAVQIRNAATYALFKYTPHLSGNKLFHQIYKRFEERGWRGWGDPKSFTLGETKSQAPAAAPKLQRAK